MKITFIGAGSVGFTRRLVVDILVVPELRKTKITFMDIDEGNLDRVYQLTQRDIDADGIDIQIEKTLDQREAVKEANFIFCVVRVGGLEAFPHDVNIPLKYGVDQCVGDTLCAGGIFYGQRGIPVILDLCKDIREVAADDALLLNYSNPMAMLTWAANWYGGVDCVGLCHGVQGGHAQIAKVLGIEKNELDIICAGINHQTWYIQLRHQGREITKEELVNAFESHEQFSITEKVRIDMLKRFGYYSTESNGHLSEYVPWYRKRENEILDWIDLERSWIDGETGGYLRVCTESRNWFKEDFPNWLKEPPKDFSAPDHRSHEHGSYILEGLVTGRIYRGHFNRVNDGVITNLPDDCIIEAPGYVDANGINMPVVGDLPLGCAAVCQNSVNVQRLAVEAAVHADLELLRQAMLLDPLVGAVCNPPEVWQMTDEMLVALAPWMPQWQDEAERAKARLEKGPLIPTREGYLGAARKETASMEEMARRAEESRKMAAESDRGMSDLHKKESVKS
jgi:alpha-galactosidase